MSFTVVNEGWANLYNPRPVEVVLRHQETNRSLRVTLKEDPRLWMPGETRTVMAAAGVPSGTPAGVYSVLLHLPDAAASVRDRPEFAVRLAAKDVWEPATGMNRLLRTVKADRQAKRSVYSGDFWFK
jgi:hypothetical protein